MKYSVKVELDSNQYTLLQTLMKHWNLSAQDAFARMLEFSIEFTKSDIPIKSGQHNSVSRDQNGKLQIFDENGTLVGKQG